jgi:hypothetical protein
VANLLVSSDALNKGHSCIPEHNAHRGGLLGDMHLLTTLILVISSLLETQTLFGLTRQAPSINMSTKSFQTEILSFGSHVTKSFGAFALAFARFDGMKSAHSSKSSCR